MRLSPSALNRSVQYMSRRTNVDRRLFGSVYMIAEYLTERNKGQPSSSDFL